jgi:hypothetical protein
MSDVPLTMGREPDESMLIRYLVGQVSEEDADQLDELSVTSEAFAVRLRAVEHDLVDAYVNGELTGDTLEGFKARYLRTPDGLAEVEFAQALRGYRPALAGAADAAVRTGPHTEVRAKTGSSSWPAWGLAAAAVLLAALASLLLIDDVRLRRDISGVRDTHASLEQRARQLQDELNQQQAAARAAEQELTRAREALASAPPDRPNPDRPTPDRPGDEPRALATVLALVLSPATRGGGQIPQFTVPANAGAGTVVLRLPLAAVDFPHYEAALKDANGDRVLWRSGRLTAPSPRDRSMLPVSVPTNLLTPRAYTLELTGIRGAASAEPLDSYPFRVIP